MNRPSLVGLIVGLYGRIPRNAIVVVVRACIDESSTNDPKSPMLLYGCVSRVWKWGEFDPKWRRILRSEHVSCMHAKELLDTDGEFKGWSQDRKAKFVTRLDALSRRYIDFCFCSVLHRKDFEDYRQHKDLNSLLDSDYGVSFRFALSFLQVAVPIFMPGKGHDTYVVYEIGHAKSGAAAVIHQQIAKELKDSYIVRSVAPVKPEDSCGVQAADMHAMAILLMEERGGEPDIIDVTTKTMVEFANDPKRKPPIYRLPLTPDALTELRDNVILSSQKAKKRFAAYLSGTQTS